jgi:hypothetical protein
MGFIKMQFRSEFGQSEVPPSEFTRMLRAWWKEKTISEKDWKEWASKIQVRWVAAFEKKAAV